MAQVTTGTYIAKLASLHFDVEGLLERMQNATPGKRCVCPGCGKAIMINRNGTLRSHKNHDGTICVGAGVVPFDFAASVLGRTNGADVDCDDLAQEAKNAVTAAKADVKAAVRSFSSRPICPAVACAGCGAQVQTNESGSGQCFHCHMVTVDDEEKFFRSLAVQNHCAVARHSGHWTFTCMDVDRCHLWQQLNNVKSIRCRMSEWSEDTFTRAPHRFHLTVWAS